MTLQKIRKLIRTRQEDISRLNVACIAFKADHSEASGVLYAVSLAEVRSLERDVEILELMVELEEEKFKP